MILFFRPKYQGAGIKGLTALENETFLSLDPAVDQRLFTAHHSILANVEIASAFLVAVLVALRLKL
jgi:hypothetical protein